MCTGSIGGGEKGGGRGRFLTGARAKRSRLLGGRAGVVCGASQVWRRGASVVVA